ncbi:Uncharacterised protein [Enterococcus faecium]|nr:Uncharacterised protein [Enterococcus faecium]
MKTLVIVSHPDMPNFYWYIRISQYQKLVNILYLTHKLLHSVFKKETGKTPFEYRRVICKADGYAKNQLRQSFVSFSSVAAVSVDGNSRVYRESGAR